MTDQELANILKRHHLKMTDQEFARLLQRGHEGNGIEFKGPRKRVKRAEKDWDSYHYVKVIRAILGMANRREGGYVVIGVEEKMPPDPVGMQDDQLATWNFDDVAASVNEYASPSVIFDLDIMSVDGKNFVLIRVYQFEDIPVLCKKEYRGPPERKRAKDEMLLRKGACYVRSRHKPETSEIPSEEEMRELLDLAIDHGVQKYLTRARRVGLLPHEEKLYDEKSYEDQIKEME